MSDEVPPDETAPLSNAPQGFEPADAPFVPRPVASPDRVVHMIGNAHLDVVWLWPWQEGYQEARATFRSVLDRMDEYPTSSSPATRSCCWRGWRSRTRPSSSASAPASPRAAG